MPLKDPQVRALLMACRDTRAEEVDCDQFLASMAQYAEAVVGPGPIPAELELVEAHERLCSNCREECRALTELLRDGPAGT